MQKLILGLSILLIMTWCTLGETNNSTKEIVQKNESEITTYTEDVEKMSWKIRSTEEFQDCMKQQSNMCIQTAGMQIAQKTKDASFCKELWNMEQQASCEFAITMVNVQEKNDEKLCDTLSNPKYKQQCKIQSYRQTAILNDDITVCDKIDIILLKETNTGELNNDNGMQKDQCIMQFIMNNKNAKEIDCERIGDEWSLKTCKTMMKNKNPNTPDPTKPTSTQK
jgi:hypothetical protein